MEKLTAAGAIPESKEVTSGKGKDIESNIFDCRSRLEKELNEDEKKNHEKWLKKLCEDLLEYRKIEYRMILPEPGSFLVVSKAEHDYALQLIGEKDTMRRLVDDSSKKSVK
jgi:hypothetical protein